MLKIMYFHCFPLVMLSNMSRSEDDDDKSLMYNILINSVLHLKIMRFSTRLLVAQKEKLARKKLAKGHRRN